MTKTLTKTQRQLLERLASGASISYSTITGDAWSSDGRFTVKVHNNTFNAVHMRRWIVAVSMRGATTLYRITEAGRAALADASLTERASP